jgi:hypothetical protein
MGRGAADSAVTRYTSARLHPSLRSGQAVCTKLLACRRAVVQTCILFVLACANGRLPAQLRGYSIVVQEKDPQAIEFAHALRQQGIKVRSGLRGGSGPTAALIYFTFRDPAPGEPTWLHVQLTDTRTGAVVQAGSIQLDSTTTTLRARAEAAVKSLLAP